MIAVNPARSALLIVDMQNSFCKPKGVVVQVGGQLHDIDAVIENLTRCTARARELGIRVAFTRHGHSAGYEDMGRSASAYPISALVRDSNGLVRGSWDHAIIDELDPEPQDIIVDKTRLDAFLYTSLEATLRTLGMESVIIGGCVTNFCVETTVRSAWQRDFDVTVLADAVAAYTPAMQERGLTTMADCMFATVVPSLEVFDCEDMP
jgi:ureidoacrylate peracid hydrolase